MSLARERWKASQASLDPTKLVFVDETGANTKMVRVYGRCRRGKRLVCKTPWGHWKTTTFTCGLRCDGLVAPWVLEGPMTGDAFLIYVEKVLVPTLARGDTVIIDNLSSHKVAGVREAIEAVGARLIYLPPYSPDLNPIELAFAKFKTGLRKAAERTVDDLWRRIGVLIHDFSPQECQNYFCHDGYASIVAGLIFLAGCGFIGMLIVLLLGYNPAISRSLAARTPANGLHNIYASVASV